MASRFRAAIADSGPVVILAAIAAAGSFTHIRDTAAEHGQTGWMSWAVAVCVDLLCVMAARERQRDARTERITRRVSWPTFVLSLGVVLSLAANLAQAEPNVWGWIVAGTPCGAFLVAVSMLERRAGAAAREAVAETESDGVTDDTINAFPQVSEASVIRDTSPELPNSDTATVTPIGDELSRARAVAANHMTEHGKQITRDALRAALAPCSSAQASVLLRQLKESAA